MTRDAYVTLVSSLPALGPVLSAKHPPINRVQLQRRLRLLSAEHRGELKAIADLLSWARLPLLGTDAALVARAERLIPRISSPTLQALARDRLEFRTLIAALRRRQAGQDSPPRREGRGEAWGYSRHLRRIEANWRDPTLGVGRIYPWLADARARLEAGDAQGLERILLEESWRQTERHAIGHEFDYEAVAIYVIKWNLLDRWTRYDAEAAAARFASLVDAALADRTLAHQTLADIGPSGTAGSTRHAGKEAAA
ncbi:MAG: hypothetical protein AAF899_08860 [Pseudomonadota bacterium]